MANEGDPVHEKRFEGDLGRLRSPDRVERLEVERVVDLCLAGAQISRVLDVGTGSGLFAEAFARRGLQVAGVDANPAMLPVAREFVPAGDFREAAAEALPFADGTFDLVFLGVVLHEADDAQKALEESLRVTRQRVGILEWPYREQSFGPPLAHRLDPRRLEPLFDSARAWRSKELANSVLYLLEK